MGLNVVPLSVEVPYSEAVTQSRAARFVYLNQEAVVKAGVLNMCRARDVIAETLLAFEKGECLQPHKVVLRDGDDVSSELRGRINGLFASIRGEAPAMGMKWIASFPANRGLGLPRATALIILNSPETGLPIAVMDGTLVSAMRTGAITALGLEYLAPKHSRKAGIIGAGVQARTQILALMTVLPELEEIAVFNRTPERAEALAEDCRRMWRAPVRPVSSIAAALEDADIIIPCTTANEQFVRAEYVKPGALTVELSNHDCEFEVISQCQKIVVDNWDVVRHRGTTTPAIMHAQGLLPDERIYGSLGQLILGTMPGREKQSERIHLVYMGMGIEDVALAGDLYRTACERNLGQWLDFWEKPLWV